MEKTIEAIKRSVDGGWREGLDILQAIQTKGDKNIVYKAIASADFWIYLGEEMAWIGEEPYRSGHDPIPVWEYKWHLLVSHLAGGKEIESFFAKEL